MAEERMVRQWGLHHWTKEVSMKVSLETRESQALEEV